MFDIEVQMILSKWSSWHKHAKPGRRHETIWWLAFFLQQRFAGNNWSVREVLHVEPGRAWTLWPGAIKPFKRARAGSGGMCGYPPLFHGRAIGRAGRTGARVRSADKAKV